MAITLSDGTTTLTLPDDLLWADRHSWSPVVQTAAVSITGALLIDSGTRLNGRPITLAGDDSHAWLTYAVVSQLKTWAAAAGQQLLLSIHGAAFDVLFRHQDAPAIEVTAVIDYAAPDAQDYFFGTLKFLEI